MDRRDWLWRKRSLEKIQGETDSSGSISSHSERFSDEQTNSTHNAPSPEVTSKTALNDDKNDNIKSLNQKLSTALLNLNAKEELLKQHEKVAEEAVAGWEKADREVSNLKLQLDATQKKNSALEDRVVHLGEALKECMWQLRESKEEKDRQIEEEIVKRSLEWESTKSELENQLSALHIQLETAKSEPVSTINGLRVKLEAAEKENASLRLELIKISKNLEARTVERDLSTQAAENASKQHLESIKKVAKLESECRVLKLSTRKASMGSDHKNFVHEAGNSEVKLPDFSVSALMDDFHDMERLAAMPEIKTQPNQPLDTEKIESLEAERLDLKRALSEAQRNHKASQGQLNSTKTELIKLRHQLFECQDQFKASQAKLSEKETDLTELRTRLVDLEDQLKRSQGQVKETVPLLMEMRAQLTEYQAKLKESQEHTKEVETRLVELENELAMANERKEVLEGELEVSNGRRDEAEMQVSVLESEIKSMQVTVDSLLDVEAKCHRLENELLKRKIEPHLQCSWHNNVDMKAEQEKELAVAASKLADCQNTIASLGSQLESLATLDEILAESDKSVDSCGESPIFHRTGELRRLASIDCK